MIKFTIEQKKVINTVKKRVDVLACPGSGKTTVLIERINKLITKGVRANRILVISFSNKAVENVKEKLKRDDVIVKTFHSYANALVQAHHQDLGFIHPPVLIAEAQSLLRMRDAMLAKPKSFKLLNQHYQGLDSKKMLKLCSQYYLSQDELISQIQADTNQSWEAVFRKLEIIFKYYGKQKRLDSKIEYIDMLPMAKKLVHDMQNDIDFKYLFVDEAQDMSATQAELLSVLACSVSNVMTFGDSNQAIYGFMGGKYMELSSLMNNVQKLELTYSHRLPQPIADFAVALINSNSEIHPIVGYSSNIKPKLYPFPTNGGSDIYPKLMKSIYSKTKSKQTSIAVLARTKAQLREVDSALLNKGYHTTRVYLVEDISHVLKVIKLLNKLDSRNLLSPKSNLEKIKFEKSIAKIMDVPYCKAMRRVFSDCRKISLRLMDAKHLESKYLLGEKIYLKLVRVNQGMHKDAKVELGRWEAIARKFSNTSDFVKHIKQINSKPKITLSTIHGAKGGEWDYVIVAGIVEGSIPFYKSDTPSKVEEERRLLYVASTRAKKELFLIQEKYKQFDGKSRFITKKVEKTVEHMHL